MRVACCAGCGAPLAAAWETVAVVCGACGSHNLPDGRLVAPSVPVDGRPRLNLGGRTYVVEGRLAAGDSAAVYRARWVARLGELAVLKVLQAPADADLLRREWEALSALQASTAAGAAHFVTRLPQPLAQGLVDTDRPRVASVFRWKPGFWLTLSDVVAAHPRGVPEPARVWIAKRLGELLGFVSRAGWTHGAVTPDHVLVHPRDHGAVLVGWTLAARVGSTDPLPGVPRRWAALYGGERRPSPALDLAMACRSVLALPRPADERATAIDAVLAQGVAGRFDDGWAFADRLTEAARAVHGPPAWHPLAMPGWGPA